MRVIVQQPVLTLDAYSAGDAVGGLLTFDFDYGSAPVLLKRAEILDDNSSPAEAALMLELFTDPNMAGVDATTFSISQADYLAGKYIGPITFPTYIDTVAGDNPEAQISIQDSLDQVIPLINGKIYGQLVCVATPTFDAADELLVGLHGTKFV